MRKEVNHAKKTPIRHDAHACYYQRGGRSIRPNAATSADLRARPLADVGIRHAVLGMFPMMLLFLLIFCVVAFLIGRGSCGGAMHRWGPHAGSWGDPTRSALQILNDRYARGEIQKSEFEEKRRDIVAKLS